MAHRLALRQLVLLASASAVISYQWPNPLMEALDSLRWDQAGAHGGAFGPGVSPCNQTFSGSPNGNQTNAAQWLRTAYHDMATYNTTTGMGGLDGSIQFELDRPENPGAGFLLTFTFVQLATNRYVSFSDGIAAAALTAVEACNGPQIDFSGGRVDATQAGPVGVPQPQDTLTSHTDAFARMGFTPTEMIQLVACGHTIGGVQHAAFPDIVPKKNVNKKNNPGGNMVFDQTFAAFDNHIAVAYVSGQSVDPLVVGPNVTTQSDARIFASDGNATMEALAKSPSLFASTCGALLTRMLNAVARHVTLTDVVEPLLVKPTDYTLVIHPKNNTLTFNANVRFWNLDANSDAMVRILWADHSGKPCVGCSAQLEPMKVSTSSGTTNVGIAFVNNHTSLWFQIPKPGLSISTAGISSFWFEVTEHGKTWVENQNGTGFPLQTDVVVADSSCVDPSSEATRIDIAVRKALQPSLVFLEGPLIDAQGKSVSAATNVWPAVHNSTASLNDSVYALYSLTLPSTLLFKDDFNVGATFGGYNVSDWTSFSTGRMQQC